MKSYLTTGGRVLLAKMLAEERLVYTRAVTSSASIDDPVHLETMPAEHQTARFLAVVQLADCARLSASFSCSDLETGYPLRAVGIYAKSENAQNEILYKVIVYDEEDEAVDMPAQQNITYRFIIIDSIGEGELTVNMEPEDAAPIEHLSNANRHVFTQTNSTSPAHVDVEGEISSFGVGQRIVFVPKVALSANTDSIVCAGNTYPLKAVNMQGVNVAYSFRPYRSYILTYSSTDNSFTYVKGAELEEHLADTGSHIFVQLNDSRPAEVAYSGISFADGDRIVFVPKIALSANTDNIVCAGNTYPLKAVDLAGSPCACVLVPHKSYVMRYSATDNSFTYVKHNEVEYVNGIGHYWNGTAWKTVIEAGRIVMRMSSTAPAGTLPCDGRSLLRSQYPELFAVVGTKFGSADNTHFNMPNLNGRCVIGACGKSGMGMGQLGGEERHALTLAEIPSHTHNVEGWTASSQPQVNVSASAESAGSHQHPSGDCYPGTDDFWESYGYTQLKSGGSHRTSASDHDAMGPNIYTANTGRAGSHTHTLNVTASQPQHKHSFSTLSNAVGSNASHNNLQPYAAAGFYMYTGRSML